MTLLVLISSFRSLMAPLFMFESRRSIAKWSMVWHVYHRDIFKRFHALIHQLETLEYRDFSYKLFPFFNPFSSIFDRIRIVNYIDAERVSVCKPLLITWNKNQQMQARNLFWNTTFKVIKLSFQGYQQKRRQMKRKMVNKFCTWFWKCLNLLSRLIWNQENSQT